MIERSRHALDVVAIETGFRDVRDNLGLASIGTTSLYLHSEDDERRKSTNARHRLSC